MAETQHAPAAQLMALARSYGWDGDVMFCRACERRIHVCYADQTLKHRACCPNEDDGIAPWQALHAATNPARREP